VGKKLSAVVFLVAKAFAFLLMGGERLPVPPGGVIRGGVRVADWERKASLTHAWRRESNLSKKLSDEGGKVLGERKEGKPQGRPRNFLFFWREKGITDRKRKGKGTAAPMRPTRGDGFLFYPVPLTRGDRNRYSLPHQRRPDLLPSGERTNPVEGNQKSKSLQKGKDFLSISQEADGEDTRKSTLRFDTEKEPRSFLDVRGRGRAFG